MKNLLGKFCLRLLFDYFSVFAMVLGKGGKKLPGRLLIKGLTY